jgi:hypothetical protein
VTRRPLRRAPALGLGATLLALAAACGGGAAVAGPDAAAPRARTVAVPTAYRAGGPLRYRFERTDTVISILPNGGRQQLVIERRLQLGWQVQQAATGLVLVVTIDSARVIGAPGGGRSMEDSARGTVIRASLSPDGRLSEITSSSDNGVAHAFRAELPWLVPVLVAPDAPARVDTLDVTIRFNVVDVLERAIRSSVADTAITVTGTLTRDGVSPQLTLKGSGTRQATGKVHPDGQLDRIAGRDSVAMTVTVTQMGQSIDILQLGGFALTPIP